MFDLLTNFQGFSPKLHKDLNLHLSPRTCDQGAIDRTIHFKLFKSLSSRHQWPTISRHKKYSSEMLKRSSNILFKRHLANLLAPRCSNYLPISDLLSSFLNFTLRLLDGTNPSFSYRHAALAKPQKMSSVGLSSANSSQNCSNNQ